MDIKMRAGRIGVMYFIFFTPACWLVNDYGSLRFKDIFLDPIEWTNNRNVCKFGTGARQTD